MIKHFFLSILHPFRPVTGLASATPASVSGSNTPRNSSLATRSQSVWVKDKSSSSSGAKEKGSSSSSSSLSLSKVSTLSTLKKRVSQVTEQFGSSSDLSHRNSLESPQPQPLSHPPIELSEQACFLLFSFYVL